MSDQEYIPFDMTPTNNFHSVKTGEVITIPKHDLVPAAHKEQPDLIREDEEKALLDHAFDAHPQISGERDMVHADELAACDKVWMAQGDSPAYRAAMGEKPWEKPAADTQRSNDHQERTR